MDQMGIENHTPISFYSRNSARNQIGFRLQWWILFVLERKSVDWKLNLRVLATYVPDVDCLTSFITWISFSAMRSVKENFTGSREEIIIILPRSSLCSLP